MEALVHYTLAKTGFSTVGEAAAKSTADEFDPCANIYARMAEGRDLP